MIILDTNVFSALMNRSPDHHVIRWLDQQPRTSVWTTSVTVLEIQFGLRIVPAGQRRTALVQAFEAVLAGKIESRIASFDSAAAHITAQIMADQRRRGRSGDLRDAMIAGIVVAAKATLATRNISHFEDLADRVINPWSQA